MTYDLGKPRHTGRICWDWVTDAGSTSGLVRALDDPALDMTTSGRINLKVFEPYGGRDWSSDAGRKPKRSATVLNGYDPYNKSATEIRIRYFPKG